MIWSGAGDDGLAGLGGDDRLIGQRGVDTADGGDGTDTCRAETVTACELPLTRAGDGGALQRRIESDDRRLRKMAALAATMLA
jgi:hypothetical protein